MEDMNIAMDKYVFDAKLVKGPKKYRTCTDVITCGTVFGLFAFWLFVISYSYSQGDLNNLSIPEDKIGRLCGKQNGTINYTNFPYLYFDPELIESNVSLAISQSICVQNCP